MNCSTLDRTLSLRDEDRLPSAELHELDEHLSACTACRTAAERRDPTLVFRTLRTAPAPALDTEAMLAGIRQGIAIRETERRTRFGHRSAVSPVFLRLAAAGVLLAVGATTWRAIPRRAVDLAAVRSAAPMPHPAAIAPAARVSIDRAGIEELDRTGARVYDLQNEDLQVVMIVDDGMDL